MDKQKDEKDRTRTQISLGVDKWIVDWLQKEAEHNRRSFSAECTMRLEESIARQYAAEKI